MEVQTFDDDHVHDHVHVHDYVHDHVGDLLLPYLIRRNADPLIR